MNLTNNFYQFTWTSKGWELRNELYIYTDWGICSSSSIITSWYTNSKPSSCTPIISTWVCMIFPCVIPFSATSKLMEYENMRRWITLWLLMYCIVIEFREISFLSEPHFGPRTIGWILFWSTNLFLFRFGFQTFPFVPLLVQKINASGLCCYLWLEQLRWMIVPSYVL